MNKYVRTEDGRIIDFSGATSVQIHAFRSHYKFVKQADTIEELCDDFVVCHNGKTICQFAKNVWNYDEIKYLGMSNDFYGAIWTDKGLIYVAKMNENGELVLI